MPSDEDELSYAPESGQPPGGRDNPWDDDDEPAGPPGDDLSSAP
jgi:hypothetical protein